MIGKEISIRVKVKGLKLMVFLLGKGLRDYISDLIREIDSF